MSDVTHILSKLEAGDPRAADELLPLVYDAIRRLAAARLARERLGHTLQATVLVREAYCRLVDVRTAQHGRSRGHVFGAAAEAMWRILVEKAGQKLGPRRGGGRVRMQLEAALDLVDVRADEILRILTYAKAWLLAALEDRDPDEKNPGKR